MKKKVSIVLFALSLSGCGFIHVTKLDVEQGNLISADKVSQLHHGMSESQVKAIMGNPVFIDIFSENRIDYVYTYEPAYRPMQKKHVICIFRHHVLSDVIRQ